MARCPFRGAPRPLPPPARSRPTPRGSPCCCPPPHRALSPPEPQVGVHGAAAPEGDAGGRSDRCTLRPGPAGAAGIRGAAGAAAASGGSPSFWAKGARGKAARLPETPACVQEVKGSEPREGNHAAWWRMALQPWELTYSCHRKHCQVARC